MGVNLELEVFSSSNVPAKETVSSHLTERLNGKLLKLRFSSIAITPFCVICSYLSLLLLRRLINLIFPANLIDIGI